MAKQPQKPAEAARLAENDHLGHPWAQWGPYLSHRQWGTVREDYSPDGAAWDYFTHDQARSRAYRWGEDGILGWSDHHGRLNLSFAVWNGKDPILKERLFGLSNSEGNHGEDVKEIYFFQDGLPSSAYLKGTYVYPMEAYPYEDLVTTNRNRNKSEREYELSDTGILDHGFWEITVEYAKVTPTSVYVRYTILNRSDHAAELTFIPQIWFRNTWDWEDGHTRPQMKSVTDSEVLIPLEPSERFWLRWLSGGKAVFTENETNTERLYGTPNSSPYVKDAFQTYVIDGKAEAVNPARTGSKCGVVHQLKIGAGKSQTLDFLLSDDPGRQIRQAEADEAFTQRKKEADEFYATIEGSMEAEPARIQRQALAGLLWCKQYYHYKVERWLTGDPKQPAPPPERNSGRNCHWRHVYVGDVLSMPDDWEYPWFAAWDLAFHCVAMSLIDSGFAKRQLLLLCREWMMSPNGAIPAYEWSFDDVNPPVYAWAAWRVYTIERKRNGTGDRDFLERIFQKLLLNFTWWVNRKDPSGDNVFEGGFLGLDNIGPFDRNMPFPDGAYLEQSDGTSWMAMFCLNMLTIALELANEEPCYEDLATKFFEHFLYISRAMNSMGKENQSLWDDEDGFFYDSVHCKNGEKDLVRVRSAVGIIPLLAVTTFNHDYLSKFKTFSQRVTWFLDHRPDMTESLPSLMKVGMNNRHLISVVERQQIEQMMTRILDSDAFLSPNGIRALSKEYESNPYTLNFDSMRFSIDYEPGESTSGAFGGNSNWRGPIWMPINYLLIEALQQFDYYFGDEVKVEVPVGSGNWQTLGGVAMEIEKRLISTFLPNENGDRPIHDGNPRFGADGPWKENLLFYEYFHGDSGRGCGASHQTGWTAMIAKIVNQVHVTMRQDEDS